MEMNKNHDLLPEYDFDYSKSKPNRFAKKYYEMKISVLLDSDVARDFPTAESVNEALKLLSRIIKEHSAELTHK